jgi:hypothetical protein
MQTVSCAVALAGDLNNIRVFDESDGITVAEVLVLRELHGFDAVTDVKVVGTLRRSAPEELARLKTKYDWNRQGIGQVQVVPKIFPGARPSLPTTLAEIEALGANLEGDELPLEESGESVTAEVEAPPTARSKAKSRADALD